MINKQLQNALKELTDLNTQGIPSAEDILAAPDNSRWYGQLRGEDDWTLIKHAEDSYTTNTRVIGKEE